MGKLIVGIGEDFVWVKGVELEVMWLVTLLSRIQDFVNIELIEVVEKMD